MSWLRRLRNTLGGSRLQRDIEREQRFHLEERIEELRAAGLKPDDAVREAHRRFGNALLQRERTRDENVSAWLDASLRNVRYAARGLARSSGFTIAVVLTLGLSIGANTAVYSVLDAVLLAPLPVPAGDRIVRVRQHGETETGIAPVRLEDWNRMASTLEALSGAYVEDVSDTSGELPEQVRRALVAPRYLEVWRVAPVVGRAFTLADHQGSISTSVLVSERYWRTRLGADPGVLARVVRLEGRPYTIVGVLPRSFTFPDPSVDIWWPSPLHGIAFANDAVSRRLQWYIGVARLREGVTLDQVRADLGAAQQKLALQHPDTDADIGVRVEPYKDALVGGVGNSLWLVFGAVTLLLLIACANVAALLLARGVRRQHEVALRVSLGASRGAVAAQVLTEAGLLAIAGAGAGLALTAALLPLAVEHLPALPRVQEIGVDGRVLLYSMVTASVATLMCGAMPAIGAARGGGLGAVADRTQVSPAGRLHWVLVGVQLALSITLLAGAGLLVRSAAVLGRVDPGVDPSGVLTFRVSGNWAESANRDRLSARIDRTLEALAALPGVEATASSWSLPGVPRRFNIEFALAEGRDPGAPPLLGEWRSVSPSYFSVMRVPLAAGEWCRPRAHGRPAEAMVNRRFASQYFGTRPLVGLHLEWEDASLSARIAGVVGDVRELGLDREPEPTVYYCESAPSPFPWFSVRTRGEPEAMAGAVRVKMKEIEPLRSVHDVATLGDRIETAFAEPRLRRSALSLFALSALLIAVVGLYGTLSYVIGLRRREVALRLALGASRTTVVQHLVARGLRVVAASSVAGIALAVAGGRIWSGILIGVSTVDPVTFGAVLALVFVVASIAILVPAIRAVRLDPMHALREQ